MKAKAITLFFLIPTFLFSTRSAQGITLITFSFTMTDLKVADASVPLTFEFTADNVSPFSVSLVAASATVIGPANGTFTLSPFTSGLSFFTPHVLSPMGSPGDSFTGDFGTFTFFPGTPAGITQDITFNLTAFAITPPTGFSFDVKFASGSASVVPEPTTFVLLCLGLFSLGGFRKFRRRILRNKFEHLIYVIQRIHFFS